MHNPIKRCAAAAMALGFLLTASIASATPTQPCEVAGEEAVTGDGNIDTYWICDGSQWQPYKICEFQGVCLYL